MAINLNELIVRYLREYDLVEADFAKDIGVTKQTVSKWISGQKICNENVVKILAFFDIDIETYVKPGEKDIDFSKIDKQRNQCVGINCVFDHADNWFVFSRFVCLIKDDSFVEGKKICCNINIKDSKEIVINDFDIKEDLISFYINNQSSTKNNNDTCDCGRKKLSVISITELPETANSSDVIEMHSKDISSIMPIKNKRNKEYAFTISTTSDLNVNLVFFAK